MYEIGDDPYCYRGTTILKNIPGIRNRRALAEFEAISTAQRSDEPLPAGRLSVSHYRAIHRHLFQDVYRWAGSFRTVRMGKQQNVFCYPEHILREMRKLFDKLRRQRHLRKLSADRLAVEAAHFLATLNAIHPFREGNGRTQTTFIALIADRAGHPLDLDRLRPTRFLSAMVASFT
jgi:cell filamentation protein